MNIWARLRKLSAGSLWKLTLLCLKHPLLMHAVLQATKRTFQVCHKLFGHNHHSSNKANAFRHALWNVLICKKSMKWTKNKQKSVFWAQKVTDLYEKVTKNEKIDEAMDLQNNAMGRIYFLNLLYQNEVEIIDFIQKRAEKARKIEKIEDIENWKNELVYLVEEPKS